jgi:hypothetical protein
MRATRINAAILQCLEHVATSTSPPGAGAADFLLRLLDNDVFSVDEMDEITLKVSTIITGILERGALSMGQLATSAADEIAAVSSSTKQMPQSQSAVSGRVRF